MSIFKTGASLLLRHILCIIMSLIIILSFSAVFTLSSTEEIGYHAYAADSTTGTSTLVYTHYYADGEDTRKPEYEALGVKLVTAPLRSTLSGSAAVLCFGAAQVICLLLYGATVLSKLYRLGLDAGGTGSADYLHGIRLSLISAAPALVSWLGLIAAKAGSNPAGLSLYRYVNYHLYGFQRLILGTGNDPAVISWLRIVLATFPAVTALVCGSLGYAMGAMGLHPVKRLLRKLKYKGA